MKYKSKNFYNPYLIQAVSSNLKEKQGSAFGGNGYYADFKKDCYDRLVKICRVKGMGSAEFERDEFPETLISIRKNSIDKSLFLGNFKLKNGKKIYYFCHDSQRDDVKTALLLWELENSKRYQKKRQIFTKGHDGFISSIKDKNPHVDGWFDLRNNTFFSLSLPLTIKIYNFIKGYKGDFY